METKNVLRNPYSSEEIAKFQDADGCIKGVVAVDFSDIVDIDVVRFLDYIETLLVGDKCLSDIEYKIVGISETEDNIQYAARERELWRELHAVQGGIR